MRRIRAITESKEVVDALGSVQWVSSIQDNQNGTYTVFTSQCALDVRVDAVQTNPPQMVPALKVTVGRSNCLP